MSEPADSQEAVLAPALPQIRCAVCNKVVDRAEWKDSDVFNWTTITVRCHGEIDTMRLTKRFLAEIGKDGMHDIVASGGVAFQMLVSPAKVGKVTYG